MLSFIVGVALGAAFSPFWMKVGTFLKAKVTELMENNFKKK